VVDTDTLATVPLFASLDNTQLSQIAPWFEARSVSAGTELVGAAAIEDADRQRHAAAQ
jgi:hypothetical protein